MATGEGARAEVFHILVVDDEANIRAPLVRLFRLHGYQAEGVESGLAALAALEREACDLMVVDLNLPGMDGIEVIRLARKLAPDLQVIVLTGHATLDSAIAALKLNAVDYIQKPASLEAIATVVRRSLQARADEMQRRLLLQMIGNAVDVLRKQEVPSEPATAEPAPGEARQPHLTLDSDRRRLVLPDDPERVVELTDGELAVLEALMDRPEQILACREIVRLAWDYEVEEWEAQSIVRPHIFRLRHKMEADPDRPRWIKTVRGRGYLFTAGGHSAGG